MTNKSTSPIGVFDSGVGGISVLRVLRETLPNENFIYIGDSANAPYGDKTVEEVTAAAERVLLRLVELGAKAIVIACNTATSAAAGYLREKYADLPIIGMEPAIKPAAQSGEHPTVLVMATPLTIRENKLRRLIGLHADKAEFIEVPCPGLVELIEAGITDGTEMDAYLSGLLDEVIRDRQIDAAVLGCTHYIHAKSAISRKLCESVKIFDGALGTARETENRLIAAGLKNPSTEAGITTILNSSEDATLLELSHKLFNA